MRLTEQELHSFNALRNRVTDPAATLFPMREHVLNVLSALTRLAAEPTASFGNTAEAHCAVLGLTPEPSVEPAPLTGEEAAVFDAALARSVKVVEPAPVPGRHLTHMNDTFINWRCYKDNDVKCPPEGCSKKDGCARERVEPAPADPVIEDIEKRHGKTNGEIVNHYGAAYSSRITDAYQIHKDRAALLNLLRSRPSAPLVERGKLAKWYNEWIAADHPVGEYEREFADALLSSGIITPLPSETELAEWFRQRFPTTSGYCTYADDARALLKRLAGRE